MDCPTPGYCGLNPCTGRCKPLEKTLADVIANETPRQVMIDATKRYTPSTELAHVRAALDAPVTGRKDDGGKLDVTLVLDDMPNAIEKVAEVCQWAITKKQPVPYVRGSWQHVEDFQRRYRAAMFRHMLNRSKSKLVFDQLDEPVDAETGLMELAHIATDAMFMLEMAVRKQKGLPVPEGA